MRLKPKTPMDLHNAEQPDAVLSDLEAKHSSLKRAGSTSTAQNACPECGQKGERARMSHTDWTCTNPNCDVMTFRNRTCGGVPVR